MLLLYIILHLTKCEFYFYFLLQYYKCASFVSVSQACRIKYSNLSKQPLERAGHQPSTPPPFCKIQNYFPFFWKASLCMSWKPFSVPVTGFQSKGHLKKNQKIKDNIFVSLFWYISSITPCSVTKTWWDNFIRLLATE